MGVILHLTGVERFELPSTGKAVAAIFINVRSMERTVSQDLTPIDRLDADYVVERLPIRLGYVEDNPLGSNGWPESHHSASSDRRFLSQQADKGAGDHWRSVGAGELCSSGIGQVQYR